MNEKIGDKLIVHQEMEPIELVAVAINTDLRAILYEDSSGIDADGCSPFQLKLFFPGCQYDIFKQYFIAINDVFYHGDTLEDLIEKEELVNKIYQQK